jgi:hypothetical protein
MIARETPRSICGDQSTVTMRLTARLASSKLALFALTSTTGRTTDNEYLFAVGFFFHFRMMRFSCRRNLVNFDQAGSR